MAQDPHDDVGRLLSRRPDDQVGQRQLLASLRSSLFERETTPQTVGRYELRERIGAGAGGEVFQAHDPELDRALAIKILREDASGAEGSAHLAQRLRREARVLAKLSHRNVLPVYDVGEAQGRVFIAMALVDGSDLRRWLDAAAPPREKILAVFAAAAAGLHAAHQQGVVHRDFKPANVLVGRDAQVHVTDFGLACVDTESPATQATGPLTEAGAVVGTPGYMPPEQSGGERVGPAADQFSFCTALVEALTGQRPAGSRADLRRQLSALTPRLRRVIARGLAADPDARWPSMAPLLRALRPPPRKGRGAWWLAGSIGAVAVVAGLAIGSDEPCDADARVAQHWNPDRRAEIGEAFAATGRAYAGDTWERAAALVDRYARGWAETYRRTCATQTVSPCLDAQLDELGGLLVLFGDADDNVAHNAVNAVRRLRPPGRCRTAFASARDTELARRLAQLSALEAAGKYEDAAGAARVVVDDAAAANAGRIEAQARYRWGALLATLGRPKQAEPVLTEAAWAAQSYGDEETAAWAMTSLVLVVGVQRGRLDEGLWWARHAAAVIERAGGAPQIEAERLDNVGVLHYDAGDYEAAERFHRQAIAIAEERLGLDDPATATYLFDLGNAMFALSRLDEAADLYQRSLDIRGAAFGPRHPRVTDSMSNLGNVRYMQGDLERAQELYQAVVDIRTSAHGELHESVAHSLNNLANVHLARGDYEAGRAQYERALEIWEATIGPRGQKIGGTLNNLGATLARMGRPAEAERILTRAMSVFEEHLGPEHPQLADPMTNLAEAVEALGQRDRALELHERALALREATLGPEHPSCAASLTNMASLHSDAGQHERALQVYRRAAEIRETAQGPEHPDLAYALYGIGAQLLDLERAEEAVAPLRRTVKILTSHEVEPSRLGEARYALAFALRELGGDRDEIRRLAEAALEDFVTAGDTERIEADQTREFLRTLAARPAAKRRP